MFPDYDQTVVDGVWHKIDAEVKRAARDLRRLEPAMLVAYCAACWERSMPNYAVFAKDTGVGDFEMLRELLNETWTSCGQTNSLAEYPVRLPTVDFDIEEQTHELAGYAVTTLAVAGSTSDCASQASVKYAAEAYHSLLTDIEHRVFASAHDSQVPFKRLPTLLFDGSLWHRETNLHREIRELLLQPGETKIKYAAARDKSVNRGVSNIGVRVKKSKQPSARRWKTRN